MCEKNNCIPSGKNKIYRGLQSMIKVSWLVPVVCVDWQPPSQMHFYFFINVTEALFYILLIISIFTIEWQFIVFHKCELHTKMHPTSSLCMSALVSFPGSPTLEHEHWTSAWDEAVSHHSGVLQNDEKKQHWKSGLVYRVRVRVGQVDWISGELHPLTSHNILQNRLPC